MALLEVRNLVKTFPIRKGLFHRVQAHVHAVNGVSLSLERGEKVGLVGESGCGKSTLGKTIARLWEPNSGEILFQGQDLAHLSQVQMKPFRKDLQFIFQDPYGSLNPKLTVFETLSEPLILHRVDTRREALRRDIGALLETVGLPQGASEKYPHEFSGGQRQRIGIARAIATDPELIIADEPVSALDVSVQAQILNLLDDLRDQRGMAFLMISHDLKVVHHFCQRILVMYLGSLVEELPSDDLYAQAKHPYTQALLSAIPPDHPEELEPNTQTTHPQRQLLEGDVPSPIDLPPGCCFHTRCPLAEARCRTQAPPLRELSPNHKVACHLVEP